MPRVDPPRVNRRWQVQRRPFRGQDHSRRHVVGWGLRESTPAVELTGFSKSSFAECDLRCRRLRRWIRAPTPPSALRSAHRSLLDHQARLSRTSESGQGLSLGHERVCAIGECAARVVIADCSIRMRQRLDETLGLDERKRELIMGARRKSSIVQRLRNDELLPEGLDGKVELASDAVRQSHQLLGNRLLSAIAVARVERQRLIHVGQAGGRIVHFELQAPPTAKRSPFGVRRAACPPRDSSANWKYLPAVRKFAPYEEDVPQVDETAARDRWHPLGELHRFLRRALGFGSGSLRRPKVRESQKTCPALAHVTGLSGTTPGLVPALLAPRSVEPTA